MYIVIGASSFIGVYTVDEFIKQGCEVTVTGRNNKFREHYDRLGVPYINLDLTEKKDFDKLPKEGVDGVILLAGLLPANAQVDLNTDENAADYFEINTIGTINVLEYCRKNGIKRVISNCSYADVRGAWGKGVITEDEPRDFIYTGDHAVYVFSKNAANDVLEYYNQQHGMKNAWFRFPPVYGVGPHDSLYINGTLRKSGLKIFIDNASEGKDICIFGDPNLSRDVIYVKDVAHAVYLAISANRKPSDTIFSINVFHLGKEPRKPFGLLRAEEFHIPRIKEKEKLVDLDAKKAGKDKMPEFMYDNQYRKGNDYLKYFY